MTTVLLFQSPTARRNKLVEPLGQALAQALDIRSGIYVSDDSFEASLVFETSLVPAEGLSVSGDDEAMQLLSHAASPTACAPAAQRHLSKGGKQVGPPRPIKTVY